MSLTAYKAHWTDFLDEVQDSQGQSAYSGPGFFDHHLEFIIRNLGVIPMLEEMDQLSNDLKIGDRANAFPEGNTMHEGEGGRAGSAAWASADRSLVFAGTPGQPLLLPGLTRGDDPFALDLAGLTDGFNDLALTGRLGDDVFLNGWAEGVPPLQAELVPVADKELAIIAAYLVGPRVSLPGAAPAPSSAAEPGLTDFIVGSSDRRLDKSASHAAQADVRLTPVPDDQRGVNQVGEPNLFLGGPTPFALATRGQTAADREAVELLRAPDAGPNEATLRPTPLPTEKGPLLAQQDDEPCESTPLAPTSPSVPDGPGTGGD